MKRWRLLGTGLMMVLLLVLAAGSTVLGETSKHKGDYLPAHNFRVEIDGKVAGFFTEISGIGSETEVIEFQDGSDMLTRRRPGKTKYNNIIVKVDAGDPAARMLAAWYQQVAAGQDVRKSISIVVLDRSGSEVARFNMYEAWPRKWGPEIDIAAPGTGIVERFEFVVERIERA